LQFTLEHLNRYYLKAHFLIEKANPEDLVGVVSKICGLNAQSAKAPYISLWNRISNFKRSELSKVQYKEKLLIKSWFMRGTVHIIPMNEFPVYYNALRSFLIERLNRYILSSGLEFRKHEKRELEQNIIDSLKREPLTMRELSIENGDLLEGYSEKKQKIILKREIFKLSHLGLICHERPTGPWYHFKENRFTTVENWLNGSKLNSIDEREAREKLLIKYFHGYGPAKIHDFAYWSGLKVNESKDILKRVQDKLEKIKIKDCKGNFWVLKEDIDALVNIDSREELPIHFLPEFDSYLMGHKDKTHFLDEKYKKKVFLPLADLAPVILQNGRVTGTWNYKYKDNSLTLSNFYKFDKDTNEKIEFKANTLKQFIETEE
jgi:uncharacterized protein YcaQ